MSEFGVRCTMGDGEDALIAVDASNEQAALAAVQQHYRMFGPVDTAGAWLASKRDPAKTITRVHEDVRPL